MENNYDSSLFIPKTLKAKIDTLSSNLLDGYVLDAYKKGESLDKVNNLADSYLAMFDSIKSDINNDNKTTGNKSSKNNTKKTNSIKDFFSKNKLKAFDTETTGLDHKNPNIYNRHNIWQVGLAVDGKTGIEEHINPFLKEENGKPVVNNSLSTLDFTNNLKNSNGKFSQKSFIEGNFSTIIDMYDAKKTNTLSDSLDKTLGSIDKGDVVILQNMNFENNMLRSSLDNGSITREQYTSIADRMLTTSLDENGEVLHLFQRPMKVQDRMREADMLFHTEYMKTFSEESFQDYRKTVNQAIAEYTSVINDTKRTGAVVVELQDLSKAFLANAANKGLIDKETSMLGLNVDFLSRAILDRKETHTALQDSVDTIDLFKSIWTMNEEIQTDDISSSTLKTINKIKEQQPSEVNKKFVSTVRSVLNDFLTNGNTNITSSRSWFSPEVTLQTKTEDGFNIDTLEQKSTRRNRKTDDLRTSLNNTLRNYNIYNEGISDFNRQDYVNNILKDFDSKVKLSKIYENVDNDYFNMDFNKPNNKNLINNTNNMQVASEAIASGEKEELVSLFGKQVQPKTKKVVLGGLIAGLGAMAFTSKPSPSEYNDGNVSESFYNEQHLGSSFVDFRERNKHYMM